MTLPHLEPIAAAAFRVNDDASRAAMRALAPAGAATQTIITERSDAILALLMPNPESSIPLKPFNDLIIRAARVVDSTAGGVD